MAATTVEMGTPCQRPGLSLCSDMRPVQEEAGFLGIPESPAMPAWTWGRCSFNPSPKWPIPIPEYTHRPGEGEWRDLQGRTEVPRSQSQERPIALGEWGPAQVPLVSHTPTNTLRACFSAFLPPWGCFLRPLL